MADGIEYLDLGLEKFLQGVDHIDKTRVRVGVVGAAADRPSADGRLKMGEVAIINYFGSLAMNIPPRRFADRPLHTQTARDEAAKVARAAIEFGNIDAALDSAGEALAREMRDAVFHGEFRENAAKTVMKKGFDHPLLETGQLVEAIGHELVRGSGDTVDAGAASGDYEGFHVEGGE
jgi:hypothetical protein